MKFPLTIASQEKNKGLEIWNNQFVSTGRYRHEGIWRRTQAKENKAQSYWKSEKDRRWRVVHFIDNYDVASKGKQAELLLKGIYLKINHSLPKLEAERMFGKMTACLKDRNISYKTTKYGLEATLGDLKIKISTYNSLTAKVKNICQSQKIIKLLMSKLPEGNLVSKARKNIILGR